MWQYFAVAIGSTFFSYIDVHINKKKIRLFGYISILLPSILAGLRGISVGTDTIAYGEGIFEIARNSDTLSSFLNNKSAYISNSEILYKLLVYLISRFTGNLAWLLFFVELIIVYGIYRSINDAGLRRYLPLGIYLYIMLIYPFSLNLMRQSISISILLLGFKYVRQGNFIKYFIFVLAASLFHVTAAVGLFIFPLYKICSAQKRLIEVTSHLMAFFARHRKVINILIFIGCLLILIFAKRLIIAFAFIKKSFNYQLDHMKTSFDPSMITLGLMIMLLIPFLFNYNKIKHYKVLNYYYICGVISTILWQLTGISQEIYRIVLCFWVFIILGVLELVKVAKSGKIIKTYYYLSAIVYHVIFYIIYHTNNVYPYVLR